MSEKTYSEIQKMNQSSLKILLNNPKQFEKIINGEKSNAKNNHFILGHAFDILMTEGITSYNRKFAVVENMPSETIQLIIEDVIGEIYESAEDAQSEDLQDHYNLIEAACDKYEYQKNWKLQTRINKIIDKGETYFNFMIESRGKQLISKQDSVDALQSYMKLSSNGFYQELISKGKLKHKVVLEWEYNDVEMKSELDGIIINEENKTIIPIDYKTTGQSVFFFNSSFWKFRYDFQAAAYTEALAQNYPGYTILDFKFIVVNPSYPDTSLIFNVDPHILDIGMHGGVLSNGKIVQGFDQSISRYKWHSKHDQWDYPMEYYDDRQIEIRI